MRNLILLVCLALVVAFAGSANAQVRDASETAALRQFEEGVKLYEGGQFERALIAFTGSQQLLSSPNTRLYMARCFRALGKTASAYTSYKRSAREASDRLQSTGEKRYTATRDAATAELAEIEPKVSRLTLAVPSDVPLDFKLLLDGGEIPRGAWGTALEVDPGPHDVRAVARRHTAFEKQLTIAEAEQARVEIALARIPTAYLTLAFKSRPSGLAVNLDGRPSDLATVMGERAVDAGTHELRIEAPGYLPFRWSQSLVDGERGRIVVELRFAPRGSSTAQGTPPWLLYTALAVTAVGAAGGTYFALSARSQANEEEARDPLLRSADSQRDVKRTALFADIGFLIGTTGAISSGVLVFTTQWEKKRERRTAVAPVLGADFAGAAASGRF